MCSVLGMQIWNVSACEQCLLRVHFHSSYATVIFVVCLIGYPYVLQPVFPWQNEKKLAYLVLTCQ